MCLINGQWLWLWFGTFTHAWPAPQRIVLGTYHLQGRWSLVRGRSPVSFKQIGQPSFFSQWLLMWFGTFTLGMYCFKGVLGMDLLSSGDVALTMGQVPCEFWGDQPNLIFQPAAPDMIWHIYSGQYCFKGVLGMDLLSSGDVAPNMGQVPCEFHADWPKIYFCSQQLLTWFGTFTCTCTAPQGMVVGTCHLQGRQPLPWGRSPVSFGQISLGSVFQGKSWDKGHSSPALPRMVHHQWVVAPTVIWHIYSHLYCSSRDGGRDLPSSGEAAPTMGQVPCEFRADRPTFIFQQAAPRHDLAHLLWAVLLHMGDSDIHLAIFRGWWCSIEVATPVSVCQGLRPLPKVSPGRMEQWNVVSIYVTPVLLPQGMVLRDLPSSGEASPKPWGRSPVQVWCRYWPWPSLDSETG